MSIGAFTGFLQGLGDAKQRDNDRKDRGRLLDAYERMQGSYGRGGDGQPGQGTGGAPTFTYDGKIGDRPSYAYGYFVKKGVPAHVAAGLVGNLMQESGAEINPAASGDNGNAFGSGQWNGPRMRGYMGYAKEKGVDPTDFDTQLDYLMHEGQTSEKGAWDAIMATKTPEEAALVASQRFWRPGTPYNERRQGYATSIYANLNNVAAPPTQVAAAEEPTDWAWFRKYGKGSP